MKHPIQPLLTDESGVKRFKANEIVRYLLDEGGIDLNSIAVKDFSREDREQFAQLIGYSWSGACDLSYMSDEVLDAARAMEKNDITEDEARADAIRTRLEDFKESVRDGVAELFGVHPADLN